MMRTYFPDPWEDKETISRMFTGYGLHRGKVIDDGETYLIPDHWTKVSEAKIHKCSQILQIKHRLKHVLTFAEHELLNDMILMIHTGPQ